MEFDIHKIDCEDNFLAQGLMGKAKAIFDGSDANSAVSLNYVMAPMQLLIVIEA